MVSGKLCLSISLALTLGAFASTANAALYWTPWVSEESGGPPTYCSLWNEGAVGFGCAGDYCDDVRLYCETLPFNATLDSASDYWTGFFSEEHDEFAQWKSHGFYQYFDEHFKVCHASDTGGIVNGIRCSGSSCDDISLECAKPIKHTEGGTASVGFTSCSWTGWYSEEQGSVDFGWNRYITGVECQGSYCDNKRFYVCSLVDPGP